MKPDKSAPDNQTQKEAVPSNGIGSSLAIGLSLGVLIGIIIDDIGLGMLLSPLEMTQDRTMSGVI